jgi:hypothetical protein
MNKPKSIIKSCLVSLGFLLCLQNKAIPLTVISLSNDVLNPSDGEIYQTNNAPLNITGGGSYYTQVNILNDTSNIISYNVKYDFNFSIDENYISDSFNKTFSLDSGDTYSNIVNTNLYLTALLGYGKHEAVTSFSVTVDNIFTSGTDISTTSIPDTNTFYIVPVPLASL